MGEVLGLLHIPEGAPIPADTTLLPPVTIFPAARAEAAHTGMGLGVGTEGVGDGEGATAGVGPGTIARNTVAEVMDNGSCRTDVEGESPVVLSGTTKFVKLDMCISLQKQNSLHLQTSLMA